MALRPTSDLGTLMQSALEEYDEATRDLKRDYDPSMEARSIADVEAYVADHMDKFRKFRHDGSKLDIIRTAVGDNLAQIQVISDVLAGPTTAGFPAAAPIFTAINFLVFTGNRVRSDFDNLLNFLEEVGSCMNSISIVEGFVHSGRQIPQLDGNFKDVFSAVLALCGISTKYISDGRFKRGLMRGVLGDDRGLSSAYSRLQRAMVALGRSIQNGTFAGVVVLTAAMAALEDQVAELDRIARETNQFAKETKDIVKETKDDIKDVRDSIKDLNKPDTRRIREFFEGFATWEAPFEERKKKFVNGTSEWLLEDDETYKTWFGKDDKNSWGRGRLSALWIWGGTGTGKSILAFKVVDALKPYAAEFRGMSVIYYFFPIEKKVSLKSAIKSLIIQIADYDEIYRQRIASIIKDITQSKSVSKAEDMDTMTIWKTYVANQYVTASARMKLHIVLDGIEELTPGEQKMLQEIIGQIISDKLNIKILLFGQSEINDKFGKIGDVQVPHIEVTPSRIDAAIKNFIADRVSKFENSLEDSLKEEIINTLSTDAGGFAFVDACLDEIEATDQVEDIPDVLTALPSTYKDLLKRVVNRILSDIQSKKHQEDRLKAIKIMLYWTALASRYLTVKELKCIVAMKTKYSNFNVIGEIRKTCAGLLWIPSEEDKEEDVSAAESKVELHDTESNADHKLSHVTDDEAFMTSAVKFREFRFEDCFHDVQWTNKVVNPLIENATVAEFQMAITTLQVLSCPASDPLYEVSRTLEDYSASEWHAHVNSVSFEDATYEQISQIMKGIRAVFTTPETTSLVLERQNFVVYDDFPSAMALKDGEDKATENRGIVMDWCLHAQSMERERLSLSTEEFAWIEHVISHPPTILESLIREHVKHWFQVVDISKAYETFGFALSALRATGEIPLPEPGALATPSDIIHISQKCPDYPMDENAYRAIGATLAASGYDEQAVEYFLKAEECSKTSVGKFHTLVGLGCSHHNIPEPDKATEVLTRALSLEEEILSHKENDEYTNYLLRRAYETLGKSVRDSAPDPPPKEVIERAIHALERATTFQPTADSTTDVSIMDTIVEMLVDSDYLKGFVDRVLSWDAKLCAAWMLEDIEYGANMITKFESAAKKEHRVEDMIACYKAAMEATTEEGDALAIRVQLGSMYWKLLEDEDLAHDEFLQIMNTTDSSRHGKQARHNANLLLSEMMYGRIKLAPTVWMRRVLAANLAMFADKDTESGLDIWNIRPNISLATAYLSSNQPQRAAKLLDPTFSVCMEWLRDDVSWNDSTSLRLLAKLLACVGLRKEAAIAYSAGFSKLDDDTEAEGDSYEESAAKEEPVDDAAAQKENKDTDGTNGENITSENSPPETAINGNQPEDNEDKPEDSASSNNNAIAKPAEKDPQSANRLIPEAEEDLRPSFWGCDGCKKEIRYWVKDEPLYLCLICRDLDLCEDCHAKRVKGNGDGGSNGHVAYCGMNHDYISGPVEGWGGIKGGIMTVQPERVQFTHWLKDIEEGWNEWKLNSSKQESSKQKAGDLERAVERLKLDT